MNLTFEFSEAGRYDVRLAIIIDDEVVWPHPEKGDGSSRFDSEDILSYLADSWPSLLLSESWPIMFDKGEEPRSLTGLLRAAESRWDQNINLDSEDIQREDRSLSSFLYSHDFSQMKFGSGIGAFYILKKGNYVTIETKNNIYDEITFRNLLEEITSLGNFCEKIVAKRRDFTSVTLTERWRAREEINPALSASLISGLYYEDIVKTDRLNNTLIADLSGKSISEVANDNKNPICAAARSSGALGIETLSALLDELLSIPDGSTIKIANLRRKINIKDEERPLEQGIRAANQFREYMKYGDDQPINLQEISDRLKIYVKYISLDDGRLDGMATSGPSHGPAILLNKNTRRQGHNLDDLERSMNFTWAHELGHILLDEAEWPALADAIKQRVPRWIETRANAFAAYLLLPLHVVRKLWEQYGEPLDWNNLDLLIEDITNNFKVPRVMASRQIFRALPEERRELVGHIFSMHVLNYEGTIN